jgi:hypothetical protein
MSKGEKQTSEAISNERCKKKTTTHTKGFAHSTIAAQSNTSPMIHPSAEPQVT